MTRIPHPRSGTEVRQAFQALADKSNVITTGTSDYILVGQGVGVAPVWQVLSAAIDHGGLGGLAGDDHSQYHNNTRGDARYYTETELNAGQLDGQYFQESEFLNTSAGAGDAGKPVKLDVAGHIDATMINDADVDHGSIGGLAGDDHTIYLLADGTRNLTGNLALSAGVTIDGRELSTDGAKLDLIEAQADVTDATNVAAAGAAMSGGAFHDGFSDSIANEHIDWTADQGATDIHAGNYTDTNTQLTQEEVEDYAGALITDGTGTHTGIAITYQDSTGDVDMVVDHNAANNFVANEHIDHTSVTLTAGSGIAGGGTIAANRSFDLDINSLGVATIVSGDFVPFWDITATATNKKTTLANFEAALTHANLIGGHNLTTDIDHASITNAHNLTTDIDHNQITNYDANKHIDHTGVSISTSTGLTGGGTIASTRTLSLSHLGIESLSDAGADKMLFWDDGSSATGWLAVTGTGKGIVTTNLEINAGYVDRGDPSAYDWLTGGYTIDGNWNDLDCSSIVPVGAYAVYIQVFFYSATAGKLWRFKEKGNSNDFNACRQWTNGLTLITLDGILPLDANRKIQYKADVGITTANGLVKGWFI